MKYIRTKDGIYKITYNGLCYKEAKSQTMIMLVEKNEKGKIEYEEITTHKKLAMGKHRFKEHIIKQADTIEELCDCWDFFDSIYNKYRTEEIYYHTLKDMKVSLERKYVRDVKLCIRTDKGLIYVAIMNDKGELELL